MAETESAAGLVVVSGRTLRALAGIRREKLLPEIFGSQLMISRSNMDAVGAAVDAPWLQVAQDQPTQELPARLAATAALDAATLRLALALRADRVLIESPAKEQAKLSYIKCEGTVSILVTAHRMGKLAAVPPMIKALEKLGFADVLPPPHMIAALYQALDQLE